MSRARTPVVLVTGVCADAMAAATIGLQWDLPAAVVLTHRIDVPGQQLRRVISDVTGILEQESIDLAHACVSCAIREDIVPTLRRLAELDRWGVIIACLPVAAEAQQVCRVLTVGSSDGHDRYSREEVRVHAVVAALDGPSMLQTLTGEDLLCEQHRHTSDEDRRGTAETACALVEYADIISVHGPADAGPVDLVRAISRPGAAIVTETSEPHPDTTPDALLAGIHLHVASEAWADEVRGGPLAEPVGTEVWQLDLRSSLPFHPQRLHERLEDIGAGWHRSRGCFWLPSRADQLCCWDGAGGQVSIGALGSWGNRRPATRLVITGLSSLTTASTRADMQAAFDDCLLTTAEMRRRSAFWEMTTDGFEPWLGQISNAA